MTSLIILSLLWQFFSAQREVYLYHRFKEPVCKEESIDGVEDCTDDDEDRDECTLPDDLPDKDVP